MSQHLTEQELIEYQFKLIEGEKASAIAEHLAGCSRCAAAAENLKAKFSALDLVADEITASDELIAATVSGLKRAEKGGTLHFPKRIWLVAAVMAIAAGAALIVFNANKSPKDAGTPQYATDDEAWRRQKLGEDAPAPRSLLGTEFSDVAGPGPDAIVADSITTNGDKTRYYAYTEQPTDLAARLNSGNDSTLAFDPYGTTGGMGGMGGMGLMEEDPFGKAPFAPASAIELVVLPRRDDVQLTIYNSADLTLVRERRSLTLKKGWNWLQFMWANTLIDPTSLSLEPLEHGDQVQIEQLVFPARLRELGRWLIRSEVSGRVPFEMTYLTSGLSWRAFYMCTLSNDEKSMRMDGYVRVDNRSGEDYEQARTRLIVGKVHLLDEVPTLAKQQYSYGMPGVLKGQGPGADHGAWFKDLDGDGLSGRNRLNTWGMAVDYEELAKSAAARKEIRKEGLSEYFLYTIEGTETIENQWGKRLSSFEAADVNVVSLYKYDEQRWSNQTMRFLTLTNDEDHNLGQVPLPDGRVRVYGRAEGGDGLSYVGAAQVKYIPVDEEVELNLGPARLVKVEPKLMATASENFVFDNSGNVSGWDELSSWRLELTNTRSLGVDLEITRDFGTAYWDMDFDEAAVEYEKHDATRARFKLKLEPATKRSLDYTVRTYHGDRERAWRQ